MFDYYGIVSKEEIKNYEDLVHSKFEGIIFYIKSLLNKIFNDQDFSKFTRGRYSNEYGTHSTEKIILV